MKAVVTVKIKSGYLIVEREIETLTTDEVANGAVVEDDTYSFRDKVGSIASKILNPEPEPEEKDDIRLSR